MDHIVGVHRHGAVRVPNALGGEVLLDEPIHLCPLHPEMLEHVHRAGFRDVSYAHIPIFRYEGPEGRQPTEIAAAAQLSKQAVNDVLGQLERAGYLKRKAHPDDGRARVVRLTARGRRLDAAIWEAGRDVERTWRQRIGEPAWSVFRDVLDPLAQSDSVAASTLPVGDHAQQTG